MMPLRLQVQTHQGRGPSDDRTARGIFPPMGAICVEFMRKKGKNVDLKGFFAKMTVLHGFHLDLNCFLHNKDSKRDAGVDLGA